MDTILLTQHDILAEDDAYHFSRSVLSPLRPRALHTQDYFEVFWLHNGRARLIMSGARQNIFEGDLLFIPAGLPHALQGVGEAGHLVNVAFPESAAMSIMERHPETATYLNPKSGVPVRIHRDMRELSRVSNAAIALENAPRTALSLEAFLLPLLSELVANHRVLPPTTPPWLVDALLAAEDPEVFRKGASGLVEQCGKAHAHVSRMMQQHLGQTPSDYINALRMDYAARQLKGTPDQLTEIAEEVGIQNMSHFHRLFRARFGMTPRKYRVKHQKGVVQPH